MKPWVFILKQPVIALTLLALGATPTLADNDLPDLGDESDRIMSPYEEKRLGEAYMRQARRHLRFVEDPELLDYVQRLGNRLVKSSDSPAQQFKFFIVANPDINAFAVPGGFITLHSGLITAAKTEGELAAVMAHEIAHITQRHIPRMLAAQERNALPSMAALIAAIILLNSGNTEGGEAAIALSTAGLIQQNINFTRHHEEEADRVGTRILAKSGINPRAMPGFFKRLINWSRLYNTNVPEFLQTHPLSVRRLTESQNRAAGYPDIKARPSPEFHHAQARLRANLGAFTPTETVKSFDANLKQGRYTFENAERYGYALALSKAGDLAGANRQFEILLKKAVSKDDRSRYLKARAESLLEAGKHSEAIKALRNLHKQHPDSAAIAMSYAIAMLRDRQFKDAYQVLRIEVRKRPDDPAMQRMLATAAGEAGKPIESHRAMAEYYLLNGIPSASLEQLALARKFAQSSKYNQAAIDARVKEIKHIMERDSQ